MTALFTNVGVIPIIVIAAVSLGVLWIAGRTIRAGAPHDEPETEADWFEVEGYETPVDPDMKRKLDAAAKWASTHGRMR